MAFNEDLYQEIFEETVVSALDCCANLCPTYMTKYNYDYDAIVKPLKFASANFISSTKEDNLQTINNVVKSIATLTNRVTANIKREKQSLKGLRLVDKLQHIKSIKHDKEVLKFLATLDAIVNDPLFFETQDTLN